MTAEIADAANAKGWRTKQTTARRTAERRGGNLWTARQVLATLRNPAYLGLFRDKKNVRIGHHEPIVTHELFAAVALQLDARRTRTPGKHYQIDWPLKGIIRCPICTRPMTPHTIRYRKWLYRYYRCRSTAGGRRACGYQVSAHEMESLVARHASSVLGVRLDLKDIRKHVESVTYDHRDGSVTAHCFDRNQAAIQRAVPLRKVDVVLNTALASALQESKQRRLLGRSCSTPDHDNDPAMRQPGCKLEEIVTVARQEDTTRLVRKLKDGFVGRVCREGFTQERHIVTELLEQIAQILGHVMIEQELHSEACAICRATSKSISPRWSS